MDLDRVEAVPAQSVAVRRDPLADVRLVPEFGVPIAAPQSPVTDACPAIPVEIQVRARGLGAEADETGTGVGETRTEGCEIETEVRK